MWELPEKEKQLARIQAEIQQERERLYNLRRATEQLRMLEQDIKNAQRYFGIVEQQAEAIAEAAEQEERET